MQTTIENLLFPLSQKTSNINFLGTAKDQNVLLIPDCESKTSPHMLVQ